MKNEDSVITMTYDGQFKKCTAFINGAKVQEYDIATNKITNYPQQTDETQ